MNKLCVIGDPVLHSKSPLIQNTMIQALGLDYEYVCQPVKREELVAWLDRVRAEGWAGFNATMPHKEALVPAWTNWTRTPSCTARSIPSATETANYTASTPTAAALPGL